MRKQYYIRVYVINISLDFGITVGSFGKSRGIIHLNNKDERCMGIYR